MKELIGNCACCNKEVYCRAGFLDGIVDSEGLVFCFQCAGLQQETED